MRTLALLFAFVACASAQLANQVVFVASPVLATDCQNGFGKTTLKWSVPVGPVQVRVGDQNGPPLTGWVAKEGSGDTGYWVTDGLAFVLMFQNSEQPISRIVVRTDCGGTGDATLAAITGTNGYLPLQLGNHWVYRTDNRAETSGYYTWTISRTEFASNQLWYVIEVRQSRQDSDPQEIWVRTDSDGRIYRYTTFDNHETLWLDPTGRDTATLQTLQRDLTIETVFGTMPGGLDYQGSTDPILMAQGRFEQGLGQLSESSTMLSGSSGGFFESHDLLEARVGDGLVFSTPSVSVGLGAESSRLNVSGKQVKNCAIPCYFTACGIAGADPPDTWKPCFQARIHVAQTVCQQAKALSADVELRDASRTSLSKSTVAVTVPPRSCEGAMYHQVPLYTQPNVPVAAGSYRLWVTVRDGTEETGSASLPIRID